MHLSEELIKVGKEASRWAAAAKLRETTDVEIVLAAVDRRGELLETLVTKYATDRSRFVELMKKRRPAHDFSAKTFPPIERRVERLLGRARPFSGSAVELDAAIRAIIAEPSLTLKELLQSVSSHQLLEATWLGSQEFWFSPNSPLPGPNAERVENGPFGNDRIASSRDLEPYLSDPGDGNHLPFFGVRPLTALFVHQLFAALLDDAAGSATGRLGKRCLIFIDELAAIGRVPSLEVLVNTGRERDIGVIAGIQSIGQVADVYGSTAASALLAGFLTQIALPGGLDEISAAYFSRRAGTMTVKNYTHFETDDDFSGFRPNGRSWTPLPRAVLLPTEIARPHRNPLLGMPATVFLGTGTPPFHAYFPPAHTIGHLARAIEKAEAEPNNDRRAFPLAVPAASQASKRIELDPGAEGGRAFLGCMRRRERIWTTATMLNPFMTVMLSLIRAYLANGSAHMF